MGHLTNIDNKNKILRKKLKVIMLKVEFKYETNGVIEEMADLGVLTLSSLNEL